MSAIDDLRIQGDWDAQPLRDHWTVTADLYFAFDHLTALTLEATAKGAAGEVLEVAAADGFHACELARRGLRVRILEPSPTMLELARARQQRAGVVVPLVRGVAEAAPFRDEAFDRVLCDSALDHLADPERGLREIARITAPDGRVVLTFVNYGGLTVRASRLLYRLARRLRFLPGAAEARLFWDSPVPYEHNFECTFENVRAMCASHLDLELARGVSLGCQFPGWAWLLERFPALRWMLPRLNRVVARRPHLADYVLSVWRPKPRAQWPASDELRVRPTNPIHQRLIADEARWWARDDLDGFFARARDATRETSNRALTGDPARDWLDDLLARGPFSAAAMLGCDIGVARRWLAAGGSSTLDVHELSAGVIARARAALGDSGSKVRFLETDLNFARLPAAAYDVVLASNSLHCITNLEHLFSQVARALRPGGLLAVVGYVGEARLQITPERLARVDAVLASLPATLRLTDRLQPPEPSRDLSPFEAVRAPEILPLVRARFEVVHEGVTGRLFPLALLIDWEAAARTGALAATVARLEEAEAAEAAGSTSPPCLAYGVYRLTAAVERPVRSHLPVEREDEGRRET